MADGEARKDDPSRLYHSTILGAEFVHALKDLPEEYRSTLLLVDIEDLTSEETARALDCPIGTIRSSLSGVRRLLQKALTDYKREGGYLREKAGDQPSSIRESSPTSNTSSEIKD